MFFFSLPIPQSLRHLIDFFQFEICNLKFEIVHYLPVSLVLSPLRRVIPSPVRLRFITVSPTALAVVQFTEAFPEEEIVVTLSRQLGWSHFVAIIPLDDDLKRDFYAEMCRIERWSVRTLRQKISGMLFERTALSKKPVELAKQDLIKLREEDKLTPDLVFRDPYFLDFLGFRIPCLAAGRPVRR